MTEDTLTSTEAPKAPPTEPPSSGRPAREYTPADFAAALRGQFDSVRADLSAQVGALSDKLDQHALDEKTQLDVIHFCTKGIEDEVKAIQVNVDQLVRYYRQVNVRLSGHDRRLGELERNLRELRERVDEVSKELEEIRGAESEEAPETPRPE